MSPNVALLATFTVADEPDPLVLGDWVADCAWLFAFGPGLAVELQAADPRARKARTDMVTRLDLPKLIAIAPPFKALSGTVTGAAALAATGEVTPLHGLLGAEVE
jgi:hypothetical protein